MTDIIGGLILMVGGAVFQISSLTSLRQARLDRGAAVAAVLPFMPLPARNPDLDALLLSAIVGLDAQN